MRAPAQPTRQADDDDDLVAAGELALLRELIELQRQQLAELRALRAELQAQRQATPADELLQAVHQVLGGDAFDAGRLVRLAREPLSTRRRLRLAVIAIVGDLQVDGAGKRLGRWLARHRGHITADCDFRLENPRETRSGASYRVARVAEVADESRAACNPWTATR